MSVDSIERALEALYSAAVEPEGWNAAVAALVDATEAAGGVFYSLNVATSRPIIGGMSGLAQEAQLEYEKEWAARDLRVPEALRLGPGSVLLDPMYITPREMDRSEYFRWCRKWNVQYFMGACLHRSGRMLSACSVHYPDAEPSPEGTKVDAFKLLIPHWQRAVGIASRLAEVESASRSFAATLAALAAPVFLVDRALRVVFANPAAEALLASGILRRHPVDGLCGVNVDSSRALRQLVYASINVADRDAQAAPSVVRIARKPPLPPLAVTAMPLLSGRQGLPTSTVAALFVSDPLAVTGGGGALPAILRAIFALTPAESEIVAGLAAGDCVEGLALKRGAAPATIITQIKVALRKTGAESRAELIRQALAVAGPWRR